MDDLALRPSMAGGHFQAHIDAALGIPDFVAEYVYWVDVPIHNHQTNRRTLQRHPMLLIHERVAAAFAHDATQFLPPEGERDALLGVPRFASCALLRALGWNRLALLGFYIDAAPWSKRDSFYAFYWYGIFSTQRHLITVIRKHDLCKCGCGGRCSLQAILAVIAWSFGCLRGKLYPRRRHDGSDLDDYRRANRQGELPIRGLLKEFRADWQEHAQGLGFSTWSSSQSPCFVCDCTADNMHQYADDEDMQPYRTRTE